MQEEAIAVPIWLETRVPTVFQALCDRKNALNYLFTLLFAEIFREARGA